MPVSAEERRAAKAKWQLNFYHNGGGKERRKIYKEQNKEREREKNRRYNTARKKEIRAHRLMREYGITLQQYDDMYTAQDGVCAICRTKPEHRRLDVDHCHVSGVVRGLLCRFCNNALGFMRDDPLRLMSAIAYLQKRRSQ